MHNYRKSYEIVGYTYDAGTHCIACTAAYIMRDAEVATMQPGHDKYLGFGYWLNGHYECLHFNDSEGNEIHPIFLDSLSDYIQDVDGPDGNVIAYLPACEECGDIIE